MTGIEYHDKRLSSLEVFRRLCSKTVGEDAENPPSVPNLVRPVLRYLTISTLSQHNERAAHAKLSSKARVGRWLDAVHCSSPSRDEVFEYLQASPSKRFKQPFVMLDGQDSSCVELKLTSTANDALDLVLAVLQGHQLATEVDESHGSSPKSEGGASNSNTIGAALSSRTSISDRNKVSFEVLKSNH